MSDIWLVGAGGMARDYARVLKGLGCTFDVIGRGDRSAQDFEAAAELRVMRGGLDQHLQSVAHLPKRAIVAVGVESLADTSSMLLAAGITQLLVEKPAGLTPDEITRLNDQAIAAGATVIVAYNRRFYASVIAAKKLLAEDGGVSSYNFEFTEWSHVIGPLTKAPGVKESWFLGNSTHVADLAFFLGGAPKEISCYAKGKLEWHPSACAFAGAGVSERGALFSYCANWAAPGRWSVEVSSARRRFIFRPLEKLQVQAIGSVAVEQVIIDDTLDVQYKPGLYLQTERFLRGDLEGMCRLQEHCANLPVYCRMAGYSAC